MHARYGILFKDDMIYFNCSKPHNYYFIMYNYFSQNFEITPRSAEITLLILKCYSMLYKDYFFGLKWLLTVSWPITLFCLYKHNYKNYPFLYEIITPLVCKDYSLSTWQIPYVKSIGFQGVILNVVTSNINTIDK